MEGARILVIDDCRINVLLLKHVLSRLDAKIDSAGTGEEGLAMAIKTSYPLIFLDIMLPGMDGFEVCRQIRAQAPERRPRIILLTAMGEHFSHSKVVDVGADGVFFKPIVPSRILEAAKETLQMAKERTVSLTKEKAAGS